MSSNLRVAHLPTHALSEGWRNKTGRTFGVIALEGGQVADGADDVFGLGKDCVFEFGLVGAEGIGGGDAADGGVEVSE